jgi:PEP-CTERM motif
MEKHVMFKTLLQSTCAITIGLWLTGIAHAAPLTFTDIVNGPSYLNGNTGPESYAFEHNITASGYSPGGSITEAKITIIFDEDYTVDAPDPTDYPITEYVEVVIGGTSYGPWEIDHDDTFVFTLMPDALATLSSTGKIEVLAVIPKFNNGDLRFMKSTLEAKGIIDSPLPQPLHETPEPSTLILLGSGLAGVASIGLRRRKQEKPS